MFISCRKKDHIPGKFTNNRCEIETVDGPVFSSFPVSGGVKKTFYDNGLAKSLHTRAYHFLDAYTDSINCTFTYNQNVAHVTENMAAYELEYLSNAWTVTGPSTKNPSLPRTVEYDVVLNPKTGYAISAGNMQLAYQNGRLKSYTIESSVYEFQYDNKGNVVREGLSSAGSIYLLHEYSQTKTAQYQFYPLEHLEGHERYVVLQMLGWLPPLQKNVRTITRSMQPDGIAPGVDYELDRRRYENHNVDNNGFLLSYAYQDVTINTQWKCNKMSGGVK